MPYLGSQRTTLIIMDSECSCTIGHPMELCMPQETSKVDQPHASHDYKPCCHMGNQAVCCKFGFVSRYSLRRKPHRLKVHIRKRIVHVRKSDTFCANPTLRLSSVTNTNNNCSQAEVDEAISRMKSKTLEETSGFLGEHPQTMSKGSTGLYR